MPLHSIATSDGWDFEEVFSRQHEFARADPFDTDQFDYLIHETELVMMGWNEWRAAAFTVSSYTTTK